MSTRIRTKSSLSSLWKRFKGLIYCWKGSMFSCSNDVSRQTLSLQGLSAEARQILRCCCFSSFFVCKHYPFWAGTTSVLPKFVCTACDLFSMLNTLPPWGWCSESCTDCTHMKTKSWIHKCVLVSSGRMTWALQNFIWRHHRRLEAERSK